MCVSGLTKPSDRFALVHGCITYTDGWETQGKLHRRAGLVAGRIDPHVSFGARNQSSPDLGNLRGAFRRIGTASRQ